jgi:hypothetical protein
MFRPLIDQYRNRAFPGNFSVLVAPRERRRKKRRERKEKEEEKGEEKEKRRRKRRRRKRGGGEEKEESPSGGQAGSSRSTRIRSPCSSNCCDGLIQFGNYAFNKMNTS